MPMGMNHKGKKRVIPTPLLSYRVAKAIVSRREKIAFARRLDSNRDAIRQLSQTAQIPFHTYNEYNVEYKDNT